MVKLLLFAGLLTGDVTQPGCQPIRIDYTVDSIRYTPDWDGTGDPLIRDRWPYPVLPIEEWDVIGCTVSRTG